MTYFVHQRISHALESSTEATPLFNLENNYLVIPLSALQRLLSTFQKCWHNFSQFKQNMMQTHCSFKSVTFHVYQNCKWNNTYLTSHHSTTTHVIQPHLKQEITQNNLFYLHVVKEVGAGNSIVILQSLHTLLNRWYIFH